MLYTLIGKKIINTLNEQLKHGTSNKWQLLMATEVQHECRTGLEMRGVEDTHKRYLKLFQGGCGKSEVGWVRCGKANLTPKFMLHISQ